MSPQNKSIKILAVSPMSPQECTFQEKMVNCFGGMTRREIFKSGNTSVMINIGNRNHLVAALIRFLNMR